MFLVVTNLVSAVCLIWTLRDAHLGELKDDLATMNWWWLGVAVIADISVFLCHGLRWSLLLRPVARVPFWESVQAIYVGLFANEVLPFRVGELLRCYVISREAELPLSVTLSSALIERIFDGIWLCLCMFLALQMIPFPGDLHRLVDGGYALAMVVLILAVLLALAMARSRQTLAMLQGDSWKRHLRVLVEDIERIGHSRYLYLSFFQSAPYLLLSTIPIYAAFQSYGFDLSLGAAFGLMVILRLGSVIPQAPGNLGVYQLLTRVSLEKIFNVVPDEAARFSLILWGVVTLPLLIGGLTAMSVAGAELAQLRRAAHTEAREMSKSRR